MIIGNCKGSLSDVKQLFWLEQPFELTKVVIHLLFRWFCEGRELHNSPDIQIWRDGDLHTLVITEAFEDDTGRYTCVASNSLGADNTSAEVYIEGMLFLFPKNYYIVTF